MFQDSEYFSAHFSPQTCRMQKLFCFNLKCIQSIIKLYSMFNAYVKIPLGHIKVQVTVHEENKIATRE